MNAGEYNVRELMKNSIIALRTEFKGAVDQKRVLNSAYLNTKLPGSSTACLISLNGHDTLQATNVGDSGFMLIRKGLVYYKSPVQQHSFNLPYQLGRVISSDRPNIAVQTTLKVKAGDVIVAGTDGLFDNVYLEDISLLVNRGIKQGLNQQKIAQTIAGHAHHISSNKSIVTAFARASKESGFKHPGGKIDDITVVVDDSYID